MKIAILHPHGGMGDLILSYPVIAAFKEAYPRAEIIYVASPGMEEVIGAHPLVTEVLSLGNGAGEAREMSLDFRKKQIDIGVALWTTARTAWLLKRASIPIRIGQSGRFFYSFLFTHEVTVRTAEGDDESHWVECLLDYPRALGLHPTDKEIKITVPPESLKKAEKILKEAGVEDLDRLVALHLGKGENLPGRGWPIEQFSRIADELSRQEAQVVLTGAAHEIPLIRELLSRTRLPVFSVAGKTDFMSLAAVLKLSRAIVCPDSGPMHVAAAVGTPVVALFLMAKDFPNRWAPWGTKSVIIRPNSFPCRKSCAKETCPDFKCFQAMPVDEIVRGALDLIKFPAVR